MHIIMPAQCADTMYRVLGNFRELPAELKFRVLIFANGDLTIYISYIANAFVLI